MAALNDPLTPVTTSADTIIPMGTRRAIVMVIKLPTATSTLINFLGVSIVDLLEKERRSIKPEA
ncbi:unnamed protein product [marine sediment metagenome]|uniref:Uncharacterized protein n=1 Tax=marine sediment metagenome TaxID=412755 RepID=X1FLG7_9ZZZZ